MNGHGPQLVIISGPSGAGKSTVVKRVLQLCPIPLKLSVSATTRAPRTWEKEGCRQAERDGVDYHFLSDAEFQRRREAGEFLECKEVFGAGYWYGTPRSEVTAGWNEGKSVILEIDVEGAMSVLEQMPDAVTIFLHPGSLEELERRLVGRGTEDQGAIQRRLAVARREMTFLSKYRYEVVNQTVEQAAEAICQILVQATSPPTRDREMNGPMGPA